MADERKKLVEILCDGIYKAGVCEYQQWHDCKECFCDGGHGATIADHLIANGVTVPERGRWIKRGIAPNHFYECSECFVIGSPAWRCCPVCTARMDLEVTT